MVAKELGGAVQLLRLAVGGQRLCAQLAHGAWRMTYGAWRMTYGVAARKLAVCEAACPCPPPVSISISSAAQCGSTSTVHGSMGICQLSLLGSLGLLPAEVLQLPVGVARCASRARPGMLR